MPTSENASARRSTRQQQGGSAQARYRPVNNPTPGGREPMVNSCVSARCALGVGQARYWLALRRAGTATSASQRAAAFAETRRITATAVALQHHIVALAQEVPEARREPLALPASSAKPSPLRLRAA
jgi:hypothetical protein